MAACRCTHYLNGNECGMLAKSKLAQSLRTNQLFFLPLEISKL